MKHAAQQKYCPRCERKYRGFSKGSIHNNEILICMRCAREERWVSTQIRKVNVEEVRDELTQEETKWLQTV